MIGCDEWFSLSELGISAIKARIDSGAKTSAIHAYNIQTYRKDNALWVNFEVHPLTNDRRTVLASNPNLYSNERIMAAGEEREHDMQFLNIKQCFMNHPRRAPHGH